MLKTSIRSKSPTKVETLLGKIVISLGVIVSLIFLIWFLDPAFIGYKPLYYVIIAVFIYKIVQHYFEWFFCFRLDVPQKKTTKKQYSVDVLTTYCDGEPKRMLKNTLSAMVDISYPHTNYLCDEADDPELKQFCKDHGIVHVTREHKINAKAGNINNALKTAASGDLCLILDPDHEPFPNFLDEVIPYFDDESIGYVQVVQAYYNQQATVIAKAAAQQTYQFYGPQMMGLNSMNAVPAIGANCTFRRSALDSIGGHAAGLTEDMHTAMLLHAKGWKSLYEPIVVAKGLVPWNYSGYCLQQLKWSRGSFGLLFGVLPKIFRNLTWKQILYYISAPYFYLSGVFSLLDFLIPIIALFTGLIPIKISIYEFMRFYVPLFVTTFAIRMYYQRWLLQRQERGAFLLGGTLFKASWWATSLGFIYAVINKKVPYIPTPKSSIHESPYKLLIPNTAVIALSIIAIVYGLYRDFNPFMIFMAFLAFANIIVLSLGNLMALQHTIIAVHKVFKGTFISKNSKTRRRVSELKNRYFRAFQIASLPLILISLFVLYSQDLYDRLGIKRLRHSLFPQREFYIPNYSGNSISGLNTDCNFIYDTIAYDSAFIDQASHFHSKCLVNNKMPYFIVSLSEADLLPETEKIFKLRFQQFFSFCKQSNIPILFSLITDETVSKTSKTTLIDRLQLISKQAKKAAFPNVAWLWHVNNLSKETWLLQDRYQFLSLLVPNDSITEKYDKLRTYENVPIYVYHNKTIATLNATNTKAEVHDLQQFTASVEKYEKRNYAGFIKGISYNSGHDWRDNSLNIPLTVEKLHTDFASIKELGANTIRRYSPTMYDRNIIKIAGQFDLKVLYGFWFDNKIDFSKDVDRREEYLDEAVSFVQKYSGNPTIAGWSLGNETWGLLKKHYPEPYLSFVRRSYVDLISTLADTIKKMDTVHPIFTMEEHTHDIASAATAVQRYAPEIDILGINSYYRHNISKLDSIITAVTPQSQYLVSEFGPKGYWEEDSTDYAFDYVYKESNSFAKAEDVAYQWNHYIKDRKNAIGGVAFCWQDRFEGTATWFGMIDLYGNKKPMWYSLKNCYAPESSKKFPIPKFHLLSSFETLWGGHMTKVYTYTKHPELVSSLYFKWILYEDGTFKKLLESEKVKGASSFMFTIPKVNAVCRMHLYVSDSHGNVISESKPLVVRCD